VFTDEDATAGEKIATVFGFGSAVQKRRYKREHEKMIEEKRVQRARDIAMNTDVEAGRQYSPTFEDGGILDVDLNPIGKSRTEYLTPGTVAKYGFGKGVGTSYTPEQFRTATVGDVLSRTEAYRPGTRDVIGYNEIVKGQPNRFVQADALDLNSNPLNLTMREMGGDLMEDAEMSMMQDQQRGFPAPNESPVVVEYGNNSDTHEEGIGGVPVDAKGNPAATSKQSAVGLTEKGEVTWNGYVFSNKLKV
jgi:hypothetical protein